MSSINSESRHVEEIVPLIFLSSNLWAQPLCSEGSGAPDTDTEAKSRQKIGNDIVNALQTSGFLLIKSDLISQELQDTALADATTWLTAAEGAAPLVTKHPTDPKTYVMLEGSHYEQRSKKKELDMLTPWFTPSLKEYWKACQTLKSFVLRAIGVGLKLNNAENLALWHAQEENSAMRLLHYPPAPDSTGNRCKAHSDYGSLTLLSTSGVSGLEILVGENQKWIPVPHIPGAMVVNIGSLLSDWTREQPFPLLATLHRVAGPASENSGSDPDVLKHAVSLGRTSIAYPDENTPLLSKGSIKDYIHWRSGGSGHDRSGVSFTSAEQERL
jgi:hypothetical protein